jgi:hypothetical protein
MIRYEMVQDDDGLLNLTVLINDCNNSRIICTDEQLKELATIVYKVVSLTNFVDVRDEIQS